METAAGDNYCMLKYLFTYEFINQYNYSGTVGKRKLSDLDIITKVYLCKYIETMQCFLMINDMF